MLGCLLKLFAFVTLRASQQYILLVLPLMIMYKPQNEVNDSVLEWNTLTEDSIELQLPFGVPRTVEVAFLSPSHQEPPCLSVTD